MSLSEWGLEDEDNEPARGRQLAGNRRRRHQHRPRPKSECLGLPESQQGTR